MTMTDPGTGARRSRPRIVEPAPGFAKGLRELPRHLNIATIGAGVVAAIFGCTGPALIIINGAAESGLSMLETVSWIFGCYVFGGLISLVMALRYQQPLVGAYSIPGAVLVVAAFADYSLPQMAGAYLVAGLLVLVIGVTGVVRRVATWFPFPIVMAMIAGALLRFGVGIVDAVGAAPIVAGAAVVGFIIFSVVLPRVPGVIGALLAGGIAAVLTNSVTSPEGSMGFVMPQFVVPQFDVGAMLAVALPLALLVIGAENAQAMGVMMAEKYRPPFNAMTVVSGIGGMVAALFGAHNANIAGPMTAICSSEQAGEDRSGRYAASVVNGILFGAFGLFAGFAVATVTMLPSSLVGMLAGLAMIGVLLSAFQGAFGQKRFQTGAFFAFVVAVSGINVASISAPFWSLVIGLLVSLILDRKDFRARRDEEAAAARTDGTPA